jgi:LysR family carnitine catabolism transcriptional activator
MNISGRLIDAFLALEETKRFAIAAERCHASPSAFSQMITRLEEKVGARLFDRDTRNVSLTAEGEIFSKGAHRIANEITNSIAELRDRASCAVGRVSIAAPPSLSASWIPKQMAEFKCEHPGISLQLHDVVSDRCIEMVANGEVDFGLNARSSHAKEFDSVLLAQEGMFLICRTNHYLAKRKSLTLKDLSGCVMVNTVRSGSVWQQLQELLKSIDIKDSGFEVSQFGTLAGLVANDFGVSVVPQFAIQLCKLPGIAAIPIEDKKAVRPIYMLKRKGRSLSPAAQSMWSKLVKNVSDLSI